MANEILSVPEEDLLDVIQVIRNGLNESVVADHVAEALEEWCYGMESYVQEMAEEEA